MLNWGDPTRTWLTEPNTQVYNSGNATGQTDSRYYPPTLFYTWQDPDHGMLGGCLSKVPSRPQCDKIFLTDLPDFESSILKRWQYFRPYKIVYEFEWNPWDLNLANNSSEGDKIILWYKKPSYWYMNQYMSGDIAQHEYAQQEGFIKKTLLPGMKFRIAVKPLFRKLVNNQPLAPAGNSITTFGNYSKKLGMWLDSNKNKVFNDLPLMLGLCYAFEGREYQILPVEPETHPPWAPRDNPIRGTNDHIRVSRQVYFRVKHIIGVGYLGEDENTTLEDPEIPQTLNDIQIELDS